MKEYVIKLCYYNAYLCTINKYIINVVYDTIDTKTYKQIQSSVESFSDYNKHYLPTAIFNKQDFFEPVNQNIVIH